MGKILKITVVVVLVFLLVVVSEGCGKNSAPWESMTLSSISVLPFRVNLAVNNSSNLTIDATYSKVGTGNFTGSGISKTITTNLTYQSSNNTVVSVNRSGVVRGIAVGTANVTVSYTEGNVTARVVVPVTVR